MKNKKPLSASAKLAVIKDFVESRPFATLVYIAMQTKIDMGFIQDHKKEIQGFFNYKKI